MNIFVLDQDPIKAAQYHNDKHVVKMILESCQLLSTAINFHSKNLVAGTYKTSHLNHPSNKWTRETRSNFKWLVEMTEELFKEYTRRYGKSHKSYLIFQRCKNCIEVIPDGEMTAFALAMPDEYKNTDAVIAYRTYYLKDKREISKWKMGNVPAWWV